MCRLVKALTEAMGNLDGRTSSSAVHSKCLVCDAPVNAITPFNTHFRASSPPNNNALMSQSQQLTTWDKREDSKLRPTTSNARLGNTLNRIIADSNGNFPIKAKDKLKVSTELKILRNSLDLPPISVSSYFSF